MWTAPHTALALVAFAANSLLCRLALGGGSIDAVSFSTLRLSSGAAALLLIGTVSKTRGSRVRGDWSAAAMLFLYAVAFSFAYLDLSTGARALILFGAVQATMILAALWSGERPDAVEWTGLFLALGGLGYLVPPDS
jgi:drug/metabolite transporter (DMT)-like permease